MTPFERKVVHDAVAAAGLTSESEGVEPTRCVVILPRPDALRDAVHVSRETGSSPRRSSATLFPTATER